MKEIEAHNIIYINEWPIVRNQINDFVFTLVWDQLRLHL